jgi:hypothetical protein
MRHGIAIARFLSVAIIFTTPVSRVNAQGPPTKVVARQALNPVAAADRGPHTELSEEECRAYADRFVKAIVSGDLKSLNTLIDWNAMFETALAGSELTDAKRRELTSTLMSGINRETGFARQLLKNFQMGGDFSFVRVRMNHGRQVILFRRIGPFSGGGVSYFEFVPQRSADSSIRAQDLYPYSSAEFMTDTLRRVVLPIIAESSRSFLDKLLTGERDYIHDLPKIIKIKELIARGRMAEVLAEIKTLRRGTAKQKYILIVRIEAAKAIDAQEYAAALEELRSLDPNDPCLDLLSIDYYTLKKDFPKALESVDKLDRAIGGDLYLNVLRATIVEAAGDRGRARKFANLAIRHAPGLVSTYFTLIGLSRKDERYEETLTTLETIDQKFQMKFNDLKTVPKYSGFVKSPQYQQWLEYLDRKDNAQKERQDRSQDGNAARRTASAKAGSGN